MNYLKLSGTLISLIVIVGCEQNEALPIDEIFPDCKLIEINFSASYGSNQKTIFEYEDEKLSKRIFYANGEYNSSKLFDYNSNGEVMSMYMYDSTSNERKTIATYEFENHLLKKFTHYNTSDNSIQESSTYQYQNNHLSKIIGETTDGIVEIETNTDSKGNVIYLKYVSVNGNVPESTIESVIVVDDKLNPFYHMPDFLEDFKYFNQNNIVKITNKIDGVVSKEFTYSTDYFENKLLKSEIYEFSQGTHTSDYVYNCY